eukprot:TCONS_00008289-protein
MKIAIEGCAHGELNKIYESIQYIQGREKIKIDLLICCGDFQSVRNKDDMLSMAVPPKYREMKDFPDYYSDEMKPTEFDVQKFLEQEPDLSLYPFVQSPPGSNPQTEEFCERFGIPNPCQFTPKSQASSSTIAATRKLNIPKPKLNLPKPMKDDFEDIQQPKENKSVTSRQSDDDFDDLINPNNISSNPDEIDLSEKESDSSSDSDSDSESSKISKAELTNKNLSSLPSFIETPVKQTAEKRSSSDSAGDSSFTDSSVSDTTSIKKPKLIRRNQNLYTPSKDE